MPGQRGIVRVYFEALVVSLMVATFARTFLAQGLHISSASMEETLLVGDHVLVNRFLFGTSGLPFAESLLPTRGVRRGEIVVLRFPEDPGTLLVKRCIGLPGEQVAIIKGQVLIDGLPLDESAYLGDEGPMEGAVEGLEVHRARVPEGHYYVLGDNRDRSFDSRNWGSVPAAHLVGKPLFVYWSWRTPSWDEEMRGAGHLGAVTRGSLGSTRWRRTFSIVR